MDFQAELQPTDDTAAFRLRPLTTGEIFDRTFSLYRQNFWLFTGISLVPALVSLIGGGLRTALAHTSANMSPFPRIGVALLTITWSVVTLGVYGSSQAASTLGVSAVYLGRPATMMSAYRESLKHWFRYPALIVVQFLSAGWVTVLAYAAIFGLFGLSAATGASTKSSAAAALLGLVVLLSFPFTIYQYLRVSLAMPASVVEDLKIRAALKRSKTLTQDRKARIFLVFVLLFVLYLVAGFAVLFFTTAAMRGSMRVMAAQSGTLLTSFVASLLLQPIGAISLCLFYFDERVRREGFDIEFMLLHAGAPSALSEIAEPSDGVAGV